MNSRPVNYSPLPATRFAGVSPQLQRVFCCLSQTRDHQRRRLHRLASYRWWIHSSLTRAVEGIRLNRTGVNSIIFVENRHRTLFRRWSRCGREERGGSRIVRSPLASSIEFFRVKCDYIIENCRTILFRTRLSTYTLILSSPTFRYSEKKNDRLSERIGQVKNTWISLERILMESRVYQDYTATDIILSRDSGEYAIFLFDPGESERPHLYARLTSSQGSRVHSSLTCAVAGIARTANFPAKPGCPAYATVATWSHNSRLGAKTF